MTLGERINAVRLGKHMTQEAVQEKCGISRKTLSRIENNTPGQRNLTVRTLERLAGAMGVDLILFLTDNPQVIAAVVSEIARGRRTK